MARFLIVPVWQGSPSPRAMRLAEGAEALSSDVPRSASSWIDVPAEAGDAIDTGVHRASAIARVLEGIREELALSDERAIIIGGDCSVSVAGISPHVDDDLALLWFDAHPDLHDPGSSPSGAFSGMALRAILGGVPAPLAPERTLPSSRVVLVGSRSIDDGESGFLHDSGIRTLEPDDLSDPSALARAVAETGARRVYVHVDVDVFDPTGFAGVGSPIPFGVDPASVIAAIRRLREDHEVVGASICGFVPTSPEEAAGDIGTILRLIGALA